MTKPTPFFDARVSVPVMTDVYRPTAADLQEMKKRGVVEPVQSVAVIKETNGDTVKVATDANGDVVATKVEKDNTVPLALAAAAAYFFLF